MVATIVRITGKARDGLVVHESIIGIGGVTFNDLGLLAWVELLIVTRITFLVISVSWRELA